MVESNHRHLYVKQIRSHYANKVISSVFPECQYIFGLSFIVTNYSTTSQQILTYKTCSYRWVVSNHRQLPYERSALPLSYISILVDVGSSPTRGFPPNPLLFHIFHNTLPQNNFIVGTLRFKLRWLPSKGRILGHYMTFH